MSNLRSKYTQSRNVRMTKTKLSIPKENIARSCNPRAASVRGQFGAVNLLAATIGGSAIRRSGRTLGVVATASEVTGEVIAEANGNVVIIRPTPSDAPSTV